MTNLSKSRMFTVIFFVIILTIAYSTDISSIYPLGFLFGNFMYLSLKNSNYFLDNEYHYRGKIKHGFF